MINFKFSNYNIEIPNFPEIGQHYIYNTLRGSEAILTDDGMEGIKQIPKGSSKLADFYPDILRLLECGILVSPMTDERNLVKYFFNHTRYDQTLLMVTILPTYDCNLACTYCYEEKSSDISKMSHTTANKVLNFLKSIFIANKQIKKLIIYYFGGEPLLNLDIIKFVTKEIQIFARKRGIIPDFRIVTNGTLLSKTVVHELIRLQVNTVQITIDGTEEVHNIRRPFKKKNGNSFKTIVKNLKVLCEMSTNFSILIRVNVDKHNLKNVPRLFDFFHKKGLRHQKIMVDMVPTMRPQVNVEHCQKYLFSGSEDIDKYISLYYYALKCGLFVVNRFSRGLCEAQCKQSVLIDPFGNLYKCGGLVGKKEFKIGDLEHGIDEDKHADFLCIDPWNNCLDCKYVPICAGGCHHKAFVDLNNYRLKRCEKDFYDRAIIDLLKIKYFQDTNRRTQKKELK